MALIQVSYCFIDNSEMFDLLIDSFDTVEEVRDEPLYGRKVIRVQHEEVPKEDIVICPSFCRFEGVRPFVINYNDQ
jgi:hypothetical protein